jgi:hypothetical protein
MRTLLALLLFFFLLSAGAGAQDEGIGARDTDRLFIRPWIELQPLARLEPDQPQKPIRTAEQELLEEGRVLFSAMIYGWTFSYIPGDLSRQVKESFTLTPVAEIPWGSARLKVRETEREEAKLWARMSYALNDDESQRRLAWESNTAALSTGRGQAKVSEGASARMASLRDAVRDAIRRSLDSRYINKPRQVDGEVVLWDDPIILVGSGAYSTSAKVKLMVRELVPYRIF